MGSCACLVRTNVLPISKQCNSLLFRTCSTSSISPSLPPSVLLLAPSKLVVSARSAASDAPQRSEEWFALRKDKLTTSTFSTVLGFWKANRRAELWHEKVFSLDVFAVESAARFAMDWGVANEQRAIEHYKSIMNQEVGTLGFAVHPEERYGWLGASPDGILGSYPDGGILEVKCPYNKGKPELALPWQAVPYYYMPQVQGQMEIMNRDWVDLYCWTLNGSALFRILRDREYWRIMHNILHNFWWDCVIPARDAVSSGKEVDAHLYKPAPRHELTGLVIGKSFRLAAESKLIFKKIGEHLEFYS